MNNKQWKEVLLKCRQICGPGDGHACYSDSWCAFTTFGSLETYLTYWKSGFPDEVDLLETHTSDGGVWGQPFYYNDLAHLIVPRRFRWECVEDGVFTEGYKLQNIEMLSSALGILNVKHRMTKLILEIKLY